MGLPTVSVTVPLTVTVYVVPFASGAVGAIVTVGVSPPRNTDAGTTAPAPLRSTIVDVLIVDDAIVLVKTTAIGAVTLTPVAPPAGTVELTFGAVVSGGGTVSNTASTQ